MELITELNFRYTFPRETIFNIRSIGCSPAFDDGIYSFMLDGKNLILGVDKFGEVRLSRETPINNMNKLARAIIKKETHKKGAGYEIN